MVSAMSPRVEELLRDGPDFTLANVPAHLVTSSTVRSRYPLEEAKAALAHHERPGRRGKIVLVS
jgi:hypothetical protein